MLSPFVYARHCSINGAVAVVDLSFICHNTIHMHHCHGLIMMMMTRRYFYSVLSSTIIIEAFFHQQSCEKGNHQCPSASSAMVGSSGSRRVFPSVGQLGWHPFLIFYM